MGKLKDGNARTGRGPRHRVIVSWEEYETELGVLMTLAHIHETHRFPEHLHSGDIQTEGCIWEGGGRHSWTCKNRAWERQSE